ncbi:acyltransferase [Magnetospirillum sp. UT-4]|uniref:acyltransferase family protein n=1 Tax=Magnetospirillum sp. UT-4 TaxID=2681467 RepID=UPI00137E6205|nr:acyltransferase [Magnetospirillum sp. UT-4]CAA7621696.1 putative acyltransferase 3 [Magnetospirillum sp. UT-4]
MPLSLSDIPVIAAAAALFYALVAVWVLVPQARRRLDRLFTMPMPHNQPHLAALDGVRGFCAIWVMTFHFWQWHRGIFEELVPWFPPIRDGANAVSVFAALSGFLIYRSVKNLAGPEDLPTYLKRRFLRIYPLYFVTTVVALLVFPPAGLSFSRVIAEFSMARSLGYGVFLNPVAWSLYVEVLFYVVLPVWVWAARGKLVPLTVTAAVLFALASSGTREVDLWKFFAVGILVSEAIDRLVPTWNGRKAFAVFALGLVLVAASYHKHDLHRQAIMALGTGLLLVGIVAWRPAAWAFSTRPMRVLGTISYSVFLWHPFVICWIFPTVFNGSGSIAYTAPHTRMDPLLLPFVFVPAILLFSAISYLAIERPVLYRKFREKGRPEPAPVPL